ncbi:hypothetical protein VPH35_045294 [Triticum aestivum]
MGAPPCLAPAVVPPEKEAAPMMIQTPAAPRRSSTRTASKAMAGLTQQQKAEARLAKKLEFINDAAEFNPKIRQRYTDRFKAPLGNLTARLAKAAGVRSAAAINLPEEDLLELAGEAA